MDKSLKKLNRLELLELMVNLSEERDSLLAENSQLRQALAAKPAVPRAAKVGSIAELAMQTSGYFEAAQKAADEYLREIKRMRDQVAAQVATRGQMQPRAQVDGVAVGAQSQAQAQAQAQAIVSKANAQAEKIVADAQKKSEALLVEANRKSRSIISRANHQADAVIQAARDDAQRQAARRSAQARQADAAVQHAESARREHVAKATPVRGRHARMVEGGQ